MYIIFSHNELFPDSLGGHVLEELYSRVQLNGSPAQWHLEATNAGRCIVCRTQDSATLTVEYLLREVNDGAAQA